MRTKLLTITAVAALTFTACGAEPDNPAAAPDLPPTTTTVDTLPPTTVPVDPPTTPPLIRYDIDTVRAELDAARARWVEQDVASYRYDYQYTCFCDPDETRADVMVINGQIANDNGRGTFFTVDGWFDQIDGAIGTAADVRVVYHDLGYPTSLFIDVEEMIADEEFGLELQSFTPAPAVIATLMPDTYGCGYGFAVAAPDQSMSFIAFFQSGFDFESGPVAGSYELADLDAEVRVGADLMANWCDDVIEEGEPESVVRETWQVIGGTLDLTVSDGGSATGVLIGVVAVSPDGTEHALGDATITNSEWGFFAG